MSRGKVLVIGAGLGGISAAISLANEGFEVEVFEKNDKIGGKLNVLDQDGFSFDLGPSIIILPHLFRRLFERAGKQMEDYVQLVELQPQWRGHFEDGVRLDLHSDMMKMEEELAKLGQNSRGYWKFIEHSRRIWQFCEEAYLERGSDTAMEIMKGHGLREILRGADPFSTMHQGVVRYVKEPHLVDMLDFFIKYVGSSAYDSPGMMNLLAYSQLGFGLWYVKGGMYNLARGYAKLMAELGVTVHQDTEVVQIRRSEDRVTGIALADGSVHAGDYVVSNMEVIPVYRDLLGERGSLMNRYEKRYEPACSGLVLHLGVDTVYPQLQHHNFFYSKDQRHFWHQIHHQKKLPDDPTIYLVSSSVTDPGQAPEGHSIIKILPHIPYSQTPPFSQAEYDALEERVLDKLERMGLTDLREHTVTRHRLLPEDLERMYRSNRGAIYGVVCHRFKNFALKAPKQSERYPNLFFTGGSVNPGGGTPMVTLCGQLVAGRISRMAR